MGKHWDRFSRRKLPFDPRARTQKKKKKENQMKITGNNGELKQNIPKFKQDQESLNLNRKRSLKSRQNELKTLPLQSSSYQFQLDLHLDFSYILVQDDGNGHVWVHNNKQGFQDCEAYADLEKWLGEKVDEYIDKYVDKIQLVIHFTI